MSKLAAAAHRQAMSSLSVTASIAGHQSGGDPVLMVDSAGRFVGDALGSGIVNTYYEFTRPERGSDDTMGTGNTASGAGNGWYVDGTDLVGSITIPANPNAIGAGAPNSTYGAVLTTVNASVRNTVFGWALGSAYPLVVAFRVRFDDNAGGVYWSEEGLIACSSGYTRAMPPLMASAATLGS
jgi:hypothetical protein